VIVRILHERAGGTGTGETDNPNQKPGPRGVANGVPGGKGGQKGGFCLETGSTLR
jgi:hypothetical protein